MGTGRKIKKHLNHKISLNSTSTKLIGLLVKYGENIQNF